MTSRKDFEETDHLYIDTDDYKDPNINCVIKKNDYYSRVVYHTSQEDKKNDIDYSFRELDENTDKQNMTIEEMIKDLDKYTREKGLCIFQDHKKFRNMVLD
jgi:hypothetical protein